MKALIDRENSLAPGLLDPREFAERLRSSIERASEEFDRTGAVPAELIAQLRDAGAFRLLTPHEFGGYQATLALALDVYEELGRIDGSIGWLVWNGNFGFIAAYLDTIYAKAIWSGDGEPLFANSAMPGQAEEVDGGYRLTGHWKIVSGIHAAQWLVVVGLVTRGDRRCLVDPGAPEVRVFVLHRDQIHVNDTWDVTGMRGTGSNDVIADHVFIPSGFTVALDQKPRLNLPLYRTHLPILVFPGCTAVCLGMARKAIDEVVALAITKPTSNGGVLADSPHAQYVIAQSDCALHAAKLLLQSAVTTLQTAAEHSQAPTIEQRASLRAAMSHAAQISRQILVSMYELASSSALYRGNSVERIFRDGMVALQHANHSAQFFEAAGRVRLGRPHGMPLL